MLKKILALMIFTVTICISSQNFVCAENSESNAKVSEAVQLIRQGNYDSAINVLNAIKLNPNDANAYNNRGVTYYKTAPKSP